MYNIGYTYTATGLCVSASQKISHSECIAEDPYKALIFFSDQSSLSGYFLRQISTQPMFLYSLYIHRVSKTGIWNLLILNRSNLNQFAIFWPL